MSPRKDLGLSKSKAIGKNSFGSARSWYLKPVILVTWEAEIGRVLVRGQTEQIVQYPISKIIWRYDLSRKAPSLQAQSPDVKPSPTNK
jgi:hypothetical protein